MLDTERWLKAKDIVERALHQSDDERPSFLAEACRGDRALRREVDSLLGQRDASSRDSSPMESQEPDLVGRKIDHYEIEELIGSGGMGTVYRGRDERLERVAAVKVMKRKPSAHTGVERFTQEARAASALNHPNIITIYDVGSADSVDYIAMEHVEGRTLRSILDAGPLPWNHVLLVAEQVVDGLTKAHAEGIVHRDLKPENLMVRPDGFVKILDFGLAKLSREAAKRPLDVGPLLGTVCYMSPEQAAGRSVDTTSDQFSLGSILYELLTGVRPFDGASSAQTLAAIVESEPRPLAELNPELPTPLIDLVHRLLDKEPGERFSSTGELLRQMKRLRESAAAVDPVAAPPCPQCGSRPWGDSLLCRECGIRVAPTAFVSPILPGRAERREAAFLCVELASRRGNVHEWVRHVVSARGGVLLACDVHRIVAVFGIPKASEDDARQAVKTALELRTGEGLGFRAGLDTGAVVSKHRPGRDPFHAAGPAVEHSSQLLMQADHGDIVLGPSTKRLVEPFVSTEALAPVRLAPGAAPIVPHRVTGETGYASRFEASAPAVLTRYVGRDVELHRLREAFREAERGRGRFVTILGTAGTGKSRLLYEFRRSLASESSVMGRCQSRGSRVPYLPFIDATRRLLDLDDADERTLTERLVAVDASLEELAPLYLHLLSIRTERRAALDLRGDDLRIAMEQGVAALFTSRANRGPFVLLLEDWHWADEASSGVLRQLVELTSSHALLVVATYRPGSVPDWQHFENRLHLELGPLDEAASLEMITSALGADGVRSELGRWIHERTEGNPFFIEETCASLREARKVTISSGTVELVGRLDELHVPTTVQAVIQTRLDRLPPRVRRVLQIASVAGREFSRRVLELAGGRETLASDLECLKRAGLVRQTSVVPNATYRFKHALTQEVAYDGLVLDERKSIHLDVGRAIETLERNRIDEFVDVLAHHYLRAELWERATEYGLWAAQRAAFLAQSREVLAKYEEARRSLGRLPESVERRSRELDVLLEMERVTDNLGDRIKARELLSEAEELARSLEDDARLCDVRIRLGDLLTVQRRYDDSEGVLTSALEMARSLSDERRERRALNGLAFLRWSQGRFREAVRRHEESLQICRRRHDVRALSESLNNLGVALSGLGEHERAVSAVEQALKIAEPIGEPDREFAILATLVAAYGDQGRFEDARKTLRRAEALAERRRVTKDRAVVYQIAASLEWKCGDPDASLRYQAAAIDLSKELGLKGDLATSTRSMAHSLERLGRRDDALGYSRDAAIAFQDLGDHENEASMWSRSASLREALDRHVEARETWERALVAARRAGVLDTKLLALKGLARTSRKLGDERSANENLGQALSLARRSGRPAAVADVLNSLGILDWLRGDFATARERFEEALEIYRALGDPAHSGLMLNSLGVTLARAGRREEALRVLTEALGVHRATGLKLLEGHALAAMGDVHLERNEPRDAEAQYLASLEIRKVIGDRVGEGWMNAKLRRVAARCGQTEASCEYRKRAIEIAHECGDDALLAECT